MSARMTRNATTCRPAARPCATERGSVLLLVALLLPALLGFAGAAVDVRDGYVVRSMLQHSVDDGVLSAQRWSVQANDLSGESPGAIAQGAVDEALRVARGELASEGLGAATVVATPSGASLAMTAEARVPTFFLGVFGLPAWTVAAQADAALWVGQANGLQAAGASGLGLPLAPGPASGQVAPGTWGLGVFGGSAAAGGGDSGSNGFAASSEPNAPSGAPQGAASSLDGVDALGACNCDSIAAGDPVSAAAALEGMGVTPSDPGPFAGDLTAGMGFGEMQSAPGAGASGAPSDAPSGDASDSASGASADDSGDGSSDAAAGDGGW